MTTEEISKRIKELEELIDSKHQEIQRMQDEIIDIEISICNDARMIDNLISLQVQNDHSFYIEKKGGE